MSMLCHGNSTPNWVCRCSSGLCSDLSPRIHILAGENVCIQAMTPMHSGLAFASPSTRAISSESVTTGSQRTSTGISAAAVEPLGDLTRLIGDLVEDVLSVHGLAARDQPYLAGDESGRDHRWFSWRVVGVPVWLAVHVLVTVEQRGRRRPRRWAAAAPSCRLMCTVRATSSTMTAALTASRAVRPMVNGPVVAHQHGAEICCPATSPRCRGRSSRRRSGRTDRPGCRRRTRRPSS